MAQRGRELVSVHDHGEDDGEENCGRAVVEQALGVDERRETLRHAQPAEERHHAHGVGGGDERAEEECQRPGHAAHVVHADGGQREGDEHAGHGQGQDPAPLIAQVARLEVEPRLEQQDRQEDVEDEVRGEAQRLHVRADADGQADERETDRVGHADAPRHHGDRRGDDQQEDDGLLDAGRRPRQ